MSDAIPTIEPATQAFLDELAAAGGPPLYELSPQDARQVLRDVQDGAAVEVAATEVEDRAIPVPGGELTVRIVRSADRAGPLPAVVYCHGGGWILGDQETHLRLAQELAVGSGAAVILPVYTPAPEAQYPTQVEQAYAALLWAVDHAADIGIDPARLALAGDSVGAGMATVLARLAQERQGPALTVQVLFYPVTDADFDTPSYQQFADGPWLTRAAMQWFWDAYLPDVGRRSEPLASPLRAGLDQLAGLPPALVITGEHDVLRDEGEAYAHKLAQAGVPVISARYLGTIHDFALLNPIAGTPAARGAIAQASVFLGWALAS